MKEIIENICCWFNGIAARFKLALIFLMVLALVTAPYAFDVSKGKLTKTYAIAKDGDGDDDDDDDDDDDEDDDEDDEKDDEKDDDSDDNDDDDNDDDDDGSSGSSDTSGSGSGANSGKGSGKSQGGDSGRGLIGVGGAEGLKALSAEEEAGLVGNWGESKSK